MASTSDPADPYEEAGLPATDDALPGKLIAGEDEVVVPADRPLAVNQWGTTSLEETLGEPLDLRLSHELPDVLAGVDEPADGEAGPEDPYPTDEIEPVGRLGDLDQGLGADLDAEMVASSVGTDGGGFSAEESAMHMEYEFGGEG